MNQLCNVPVREYRLTSPIENERLPAELGWTKQADPVTLEEISRMSELIGNATNLLTPSESSNATSNARKRDLHAGFAL